MIRVLIADDHTIFRQGLAQLLGSVEDMEICGEASDGREALKLISETVPDIAILDISMPGLNGLETLQEIKRRGLATKTVLLTMHSEPDAANRAIREGAQGYVLKDNAFEDLLYAIRAVASGGTFISPMLAAGMLNPRKERRKPGEQLTRREREVLALIASGLTNRQIAEKLFISIKTVETHRARIMHTLDLHTTADLVRYALENDLN
ncbi:MAG: response regulator transcription factor [Blastocatellia bacterium]|nr:response regulator transcription factor [Blastocatellia bacterium]